ncbi:BrnA antitoxin family protein [Oxalobacteraceae bacterium OTU3CAMAD1]|nr:BrnA antitoxin family protein [Oxalobacteraceae bacterium OTU3CAMAD1]
MDKEYDFSKGKRGPIIDPTGKTRITIMLDDDVIAYFRDEAEAQGTGYQTMINATLRDAIKNIDKRNKDNQPLTLAGLRKVLREELDQRLLGAAP